MATCADCGRIVYYYSTLRCWAEPDDTGNPPLRSCRVFYDPDDGILGVDYHAPNGVQQRRLRISAPKGTQ